MEIDRLEVTKIIEQEVKPNENLIVWSDVFLKALKKTLEEQILVHGVDPETAKTRLMTYVSDRMQNELRTD